MLSLKVEVKGVDKVIRDIEAKYGRRGLATRGSKVLVASANAVLVPAMAQQAPVGTNSPWSRPGARRRNPGPMRQRAYARPIRPRAPEVAAAFAGFRAEHAVMVMRGTKPHDIPNHMGGDGVWRHPGARPNDVIGRAVTRGTEKRLVRDVEARLKAS